MKYMPVQLQTFWMGQLAGVLTRAGFTKVTTDPLEKNQNFAEKPVEMSFVDKNGDTFHLKISGIDLERRKA